MYHMYNKVGLLLIIRTRKKTRAKNCLTGQVKSIEAFKAWIRAYRNINNDGSSTDQEQEFSTLFFDQFFIKLEERDHEQRKSLTFWSFFMKAQVRDPDGESNANG